MPDTPKTDTPKTDTPKTDTPKTAHRKPEATEAGGVPAGSSGGAGAGRHLRRIAGSLGLGAVLWFLGTVFGQSVDYQFGYLFRLSVALVTTLLVAWFLHRWMCEVGRRWLVPIALSLAVIAPVVLLRFKHFNGEMMPQFEWRFGGTKAPEMISEVSAEPRLGAGDQDAALVEASGDGETVSGDKTVSGGGADGAPADLVRKASRRPPEGSSARFDAASWTQFLGERRDGLLVNREFSLIDLPSRSRELWRQGVGKGWASFAVADGRAFTLEQRDGDECVTAYRLADGALLWIRKSAVLHTDSLGGTGPRSTPLVHDGRVYTQGATGLVRCLEAATGATVWEADLLAMAGWTQEASEQAIVWGRSGSPLMVDGKVVLPFGGPGDESVSATAGRFEGRSLVAFDAASGAVVWTAGDDQISYASPVLMTLSGVEQIVSVNESSVTGHRIVDGAELWTFDWPGQSNAAASCSAVVPAGPDRLIIGKGYFGGSSLVEIGVDGDDWAAQELWHSTEVLRTKFNHACVLGDVAYSISNGRLEAATVDDGRALWTQPHRGRYEQGQVLGVEDTLVVQAEDGYVAFVRATPDAFEEVTRLPALSSKTWNIPVVSGRFVLVRNDREAVCYELPPRRSVDETDSGDAPAVPES